MELEDKKLVLQKIALLQTLVPTELDSILTFVKLVSFSANALIIQQGKTGNSMYIIKSGRVQVNVRLPGNIENKIAVLAEQDFFGEVALIDGSAATASVTTLTKTQCYFISTEAFKALRLSAPLTAFKIMTAINQGVSARLHYINQQIAGRLIDIKTAHTTSSSLKLSKPTSATFTNLSRLNIDINFLFSLGIFNYFSQTELKELFNYLQIRTAARDCVLFSEKGAADAFYIVAQGAVQITVAKNHKISKLSVVGPGAIFGLLSYFDHQVHTATATAREELVLLEFKHSDMVLLQQQNSELFYKWYYALSQTLINMLRAADKDLIRLASRLA